MNRPTLGARLRYRFDNLMARGPAALMAMLGLLAVILLIAFSLVVYLARIAPLDEGAGAAPSFLQVFWASLMRTLDSGTMGGDSGTFGLVMLAVTLVGIFILSALIGIINNGIGDRLDSLRRGRSGVLEQGHTVILGWSDPVFTIVPELVKANENRPRACIVILGDADKVEMESALRERVGDTGRTRLVCRSGSPISTTDLKLVSLDTARAILILSPGGEDPDAEVIKTLLAITNNPGRKEGRYHIVAEIRDPRNQEIARIVGRDEAELVLVGDLVARIVAQTCRAPGLSVVYNELLDFGGDEIYFAEEPALTGRTFGEALLAYEDSALIGFARDGTARLNPPMDTPLLAGDRLIAISEDDDTVRLNGASVPPIEESAIVAGGSPRPAPERTLVLGWNWRGVSIVRQLDAYVAAGSSVTVVADVEGLEETLEREVRPGLRNLEVAGREADTADRTVLDGLEVAGYDHLVILCYSDTLEAQAADSRTLMTLLHLRDIADKRGTRFNLVSEMQDINNRELAEIARVNDFIVSDRIISLLLAQVSENKELNAVFADIFDPEGSELYLKPADRYVRPGAAVSFYTVVEAARRRGEVAIGYKLAALAQDAERAYGVTINPDKSVKVAFGPTDRVVVLAED